MTIGEVSALTGVSVRALRLYDGLGLLRPAAVSDSGYRLYDDEALERLSAILLFKELEFPLKDIRGILPQYREYEQKSAGRTKAQELSLGAGLMDILAAFGGMRDADPAGEAARAQVEKLQAYITEHFYTCSDSILLGLGHMYAGGGAMTENIDAAGGPGTAEFAWRAIEAKCAKGD